MSCASKQQSVGFLVAGAQKSGTTALDAYLRQHPQIGMPAHKEVHFFDNEKVFASNRVDYSIYSACFSPSPDNRILGETTPAYMYWYSVPQRVWRYNPAMKWVLILRNPIERAFSHWNMQRDRGKDPRPFMTAIEGEYLQCRASLPLQCREYAYLARGFYTEQIRRILYCFPHEQLLVIKNDDFRCKPDKVLQRVWDFLQVDALSVVELSSRENNSGKYMSAMGKMEREKLTFIYEYEIRQ
ncbi:MAG TPA: sulfotransferase, partial [Chromatiaceae bacterium]|nr:sulfotransferase [Chromatiaceae bacterium]